MEKQCNMKHLFAFIFYLFSLFSNAQKSDFGNWLIYFGNQPLSKKINWHNEVQYRNFNAIGDLEQLLIRTGLGYNLAENNHNVLLGYGFIHAQPYNALTNNKNHINEHRIFQQYIYKHKYSRIIFLHRLRYEQRFINDNFNTRYRYFLALNIPINKAVMQKNTIYASIYNELFLHGTQAKMYDRNRLYGAIGLQLSQYFKLEIGAMSQILAKTQRTQFQIVVFNTLPFQ